MPNDPLFPTTPVPLPVEIPSGPLTKSLRASIESAVKDIVPDGKRGAVLAIADHEGATIAVATKVGDSWRIGGDVQRKWGGAVQGRVMVVGSW